LHSHRAILSTLSVTLLLTAPSALAIGDADLAWTQVDNADPTPRYRHAMAFDTDRQEAILFGGSTGETDTWIWDTATDTWLLAATNGPSRRGDHAMVYDPIRKVTILCGGFYNGTAYKDVWEWNGATRTWTQLPPSAWLPETRSDHGMAFDSMRGRIVLYGGSSAPGSANNTLEFDGNGWSVISTEDSPGVQFGMGFTYDSLRGAAVLVRSTAPWPAIDAIVDEYVTLGSSQEWITPQVDGDMPESRIGPVLTFDSVRNETVMFGGVRRVGQSSYMGSGGTWTYDANGWTPRPAGPARHHHAMVFDPIRAEALSYSGNANSCVCDAFRNMQAWNGTFWATRWSRLSLTPIFAPGMTFDESRGVCVLYGGLRLNPFGFGNVPPLSATWEWDGSTWTLRFAGSAPGARYRTQLAYDPIRERVILFGGSKSGSAASTVAETWFYDGTDWTQGPLGTTPRMRHGVAFDRHRDRLVVFGGQNASEVELGDTAEFDGTSWTEVALSGPSPRRWPVMAYDEARQRVVLFGGASGSTLLNDTWEWDGESWSEVQIPASQRPPARQAAGFAYDPDRQRIVMYAGHASASGNASIDDVWSFDGTTWTELSDSGAVAKTYAGFAYDRTRKNFVLAGGSSIADSNYSTAQTWIASAACNGPLGDLDCDGSVGASDLALLLGSWGPGEAGDLDGDGSVGPGDLAILLGNWGM